MPINTWYQFPRAKAGGYWLSLMFQYSPVKELRLNLRPSEAASINNMREKINPNNLTKGVMAVGAFGLLTAYKIGHRVL